MDERRRMTAKECEDVIKQEIEKRPGIHHTLLLERAAKRGCTVKKTAEKAIKQLLDHGEIAGVLAKRRKCYVLKSADAYNGDMPARFAARVAAISERLDTMKDGFTTHSLDAQRFVCDEMCERIERSIEDSNKWIKELNVERAYEYEYKEMRSNITESLADAKISNDLKNRICAHLDDVVEAMMDLREKEERLKEIKGSTRQSKERQKAKGKIEQLGKQIGVLTRDMLDLENLLRESQSATPDPHLGDTMVERICSMIGSSQRQFAEHTGMMAGRVELLKGLEDAKTVPRLIADLDEQVSVLGMNLEKVGETTNKIATSGRQNAISKRLCSKMSETESNLKAIRTAVAPQR